MATKPGINDAQPGSMLLVVHDFVARSGDELSLAKGDRIELIERDDEFGDGWFLGKHLANGKSGLFPAVYTTSAPKGTLTNNINKLTRPGDNATKPVQTATTVPTDPTDTAAVPSAQSNPPDTPASTHSSTSAQSPLAQTTLRSSISSATSQGRSFAVSNESPVMNETLSVIDEHITDMRTPRSSSYTNGNKRDTITSVYSSQPSYGHRSYIAGTETDEEEQHSYTQEEVMTWGPDRMAEYLEDGGVEPSHCKVFREQDISGEVFLAMDQNSLFIKEFELGSVGRRLKTWHKIKALQDEVRQRGRPDANRRTSNYSASTLDQSADDPHSNRNRASTLGANLPRALSTANKPSTRGDAQAGRQPSLGATRSGPGISPLQNMTSMTREDAAGRPSAQGIRDLNHSRRHSSIASIESLSADASARLAARKQTPPESRWQPSQTILNGKGTHGYTTSVDSQVPNWRNSAAPSSPGEVERGYFSSTEVEERHRRRNLLSKRNSSAASPGHSRNTSTVTANRASIISGSTVSTRDPMSPAAPGSQSTTQSSRFSAFRSATSPAQVKSAPSPRNTVHPVVTKLDPDKSTLPDTVTASPQQETEGLNAAASASPSGFGRGLFASAKAKVSGFRSTSEAITKDEKSPLDRTPTMIRSRNLGSPTGASTPSTETKSLELSKSDLNSRASTGTGENIEDAPAKRRPRAKSTKSKKHTSAYTKGLEKKTPSEQMLTCDYSGWMKKKSGSLMTTWKPRLFVLRGRRLSYYYSDQDTEEKGLIDISFHRVLPATNEMLPALHATVTGAAASPTSPNPAPGGDGTHQATPTIAQQDLRNYPPAPSELADDSGLFIFKLVPPKSGLAKGVNFTKPTVHYFAVNSRQEGRLWMAALMKATIERDGDGVVSTTYSQKTISLAKARARKERPPALREEGDEEVGEGGEEEAEEGEETFVDSSADLSADRADDGDSSAQKQRERGLGIGGFEDPDGDTTPGAEKADPLEGGETMARTVTAVTEP